MLPSYKFQHYRLYFEHVQEIILQNFLHTSVKCCTNTEKFPAHSVKIWSRIFLSSAGNMFPTLQPPNTGALSL